jgi:ABC-2 type transport system ATP-binding protein
MSVENRVNPGALLSGATTQIFTRLNLQPRPVCDIPFWFMPSAILLEDLTKRYRDVSALNGLNLAIAEGSIFGLVGPNGAGKTTAIKILMNILHASSGRAQILDWDSRDLAGRAFCSIGYVSENQKLPEWMTVSYFLAYVRNFYPTWDRDLERELVKRFDLPTKRKLKKLSRGMRMKVALASSLAYRPRLLVMDEPFSGLDPLVRDELIECIVQRAGDATLLISSHDLGEMESFATHIGYLEAGLLRFSEELRSLTSRFRQVELALGAAPSLPGTLPESWMHLDASSSTVRFIESQYDQDRTGSDIVRIFGEAARATYAPMSLRSIFLSIARDARAAGENRA